MHRIDNSLLIFKANNKLSRFAYLQFNILQLKSLALFIFDIFCFVYYWLVWVQFIVSKLIISCQSLKSLFYLKLIVKC